jgi:hypothetical protein
MACCSTCILSCRQPYSKPEWEAALDEIGEIRGFDSIVDRIADEVTPLLLCAYLRISIMCTCAMHVQT